PLSRSRSLVFKTVKLSSASDFRDTVCFWYSMLLVFSAVISLFSDSGVSWYDLSIPLSHTLNLVFYALGFIVLCSWCFYAFGVSLIWSLCSGALVLLCSDLSILVLWCFSDLVSLFWCFGVTMTWFPSLTLVMYAFGDVCLGPFLPISQALGFYALVFLCFGVSKLWCFYALVFLCFGVSMLWCFGDMSLLDL
ncbi:hypothetical protein EDC96DRAFT_550417, partial [Choanephora cucurbitarum]